MNTPEEASVHVSESLESWLAALRRVRDIYLDSMLEIDLNPKLSEISLGVVLNTKRAGAKIAVELLELVLSSEAQSENHGSGGQFSFAKFNPAAKLLPNNRDEISLAVDRETVADELKKSIKFYNACLCAIRVQILEVWLGVTDELYDLYRPCLLDKQSEEGRKFNQFVKHREAANKIKDYFDDLFEEPDKHIDTDERGSRHKTTFVLSKRNSDIKSQKELADELELGKDLCKKLCEDYAFFVDNESKLKKLAKNLEAQKESEGTPVSGYYKWGKRVASAIGFLASIAALVLFFIEFN